MTHLHVSLIHRGKETVHSSLTSPAATLHKAKAPQSPNTKFTPFSAAHHGPEGEFVRSECGRSRGRVRERGVRARERRGRGKWAMRERGRRHR